MFSLGFQKRTRYRKVSPLPRLLRPGYQRKLKTDDETDLKGIILFFKIIKIENHFLNILINVISAMLALLTGVTGGFLDK